ncbi:MAG: tetratricopeptide repeat protein [Phycisphaerae bacterium]|nr:tetratricopeptide repeat protein [Phycisphaerae bacterium]
MEIGTATGSAFVNSLISLYGQGTTSSSSGTPSSSSLYGASALLSIGQSSTTDAGYSYLSAGRTGLAAAVPVFDATSLLQAQASIPETAKSDEQIEQEEAAVQEALDHLSAGEHDQARSILNELLKEDPMNAMAVHAMGAVEMDLQEYEKAEKLFLKAHYLDADRGADADARNAHLLQNDDDSVFSKARQMVSSADTLEQGIRLLVNLTDRAPTHTEAHMLLGESLLKEADVVNGLQQFNRALVTADASQALRIENRMNELVEMAPEQAYLHHLLGKAQLAQGKYEEAVTTLAHATELADGEDFYGADRARALVGLGRRMLSSHDISGAIRRFEEAAVQNSLDADVKVALAEGYTARARYKLRLGSEEAAIQDFSLAARKLGSDGDESLRRQIAISAYVAGLAVSAERQQAGEDIDAEVVAFQVAYDMNPENATYKRKLADTRSAMGDQFMADKEYAKAAAAYSKAYALYKNDTTYKQNTINAYRLQGDEEMEDRQFDKAIATYRKAYLIDTNDKVSKESLAAAYNARGLRYMEDKKWGLAAADFREALALVPQNTTYQDNYDSVKDR